jgi:hypothetical protein
MCALLAGLQPQTELGRSITTFPYFQDFEGTPFPPNEWLVYEQSGISASWSANTTYNHTDPGTFSLMHLAGDPLDGDDGWLVIPNVVIPATGGWTLSFWSYNADPQLYQNNVNYNQVLVSTTTPDPDTGNYSGIWTPFTVAENWHFNQVDLSPYLNQTIHIAFRYVGTAAHSWYLDDVRIEEHSGIHEFPWLENFESGIFPPYYWFYDDSDGSGLCWSWNTNQNHSPDGLCSAMHLAGDGNIIDYEEDYLISPAIQVPGLGYSLSFRALNMNLGYWGGNVVLVSTGSSDPDDGQFVDLTYNPVPLGDDWYHYEFDLSPWAYQTIYIAFLYFDGVENAHEWYLDDVQISQYEGIGGFPWCENFEFSQFPPSLWSSYDLDGVDGSWFLASWEACSDGGVNSACHWYCLDQPVQDGWLVSPLLQLPAESAIEFSFWGKNTLYDVYGAPNSVWLSEGSPDPDDGDYVQVWTDTDGYDFWDQKSVILNDWAGSEVYLAFRVQSQSHEWYVDNVMLQVAGNDITGPTISHYPMLNTLRSDIPCALYAYVEDQAGVAYLGAYYQINQAGDWIWQGGTDLGGGNWMAEIPAQQLGTEISYVLVASDFLNNLTYSQGYTFWVNDPVWLYYDSLGQTGWAGWNDCEWKLGVLYENPLWGQPEQLQINKGTAAFRLDDTGNLEIYSTNDPWPSNLVQILAPQPQTVLAEQWIEISTPDLELDSHYFFIVYSGINATNGFAHDVSRSYPGNCYFHIDAEWIDLANTGVFMLRVEVQTAGGGLTAPELSILSGSEGPELHWTVVDGADRYHVYSSDDPAVDQQYWGLFDTTEALTLGALGDAARNFFYVIAEQDELPAQVLPGPKRPVPLPFVDLRRHLK